MKISYNWLKAYLDFEMPAEELGDLLTEIGLEVEGIEHYESIQGGLEGLVIGEVVHKQKHPNADKLSLTKVNVGNGGPLQIVCGAPNVAEGQKVVVATVGTTLYPTEGDSFNIKRSKIRGVESEGMICAEDEIGLGQSHDGIMVLPTEVKVGTPAHEFFKVEKDVVFDIGLTPNRSDATCHLGVAEDLAAALKVNYGHSGKVNKPDVNEFAIDSEELIFDVSVENTIACPRYSGVSIKNIKIGPSPDWLQNRLKAIGVRPISNVVDITNFILHELGQPLHAFDAREVSGQKIIVKNLPEGSKFTTLDEIERSLSAEDLMICDGDSNGMCIGGVFGGIKSGVKDDTTAIFLEAAHFEAIQLRRSSTRHLLRTDAAKVFEKGSDPNNTVYALKRAANMIKELAGGTIASSIVDIYPEKIEKHEVEVAYANVSRLIGVDIPVEEMHAILDALHIDILEKDDTSMRVAIPTNKIEVTREADVIEEILRIYGFNRVEIPEKIHSSLSYTEHPNPHKMRNIAADFLSGNGFLEIMEMSITQSKYYKEILPWPEEELVYINNTSNQDFDIMRPDMLFSALDVVLHNQNHRNADLRLYEFGYSYLKKEGKYEEKPHFTLIITGQRQSESWLNSAKAKTSFYTIKSYVGNLLKKLGISGYQETVIENEIFQFGMRYHRGQQVLVEFGRLNDQLTSKMGIKQEVWYADVHWSSVMKALKSHKVLFAELPKYPSIRRDLTLVIDKNVNFSAIAGIAKKEGKKLLREINLFDVYENEEKLGKGKKSYAVSFVFLDEQKTLRDKDVDKVMNRIMSESETKLNALIRR
ncbi:MAG: phenylalanine--tRNA ligase subunit beta [Bacteroidota bacterium]